MEKKYIIGPVQGKMPLEIFFKMIFFQQKDCDIHNQRPFFVYKMKIPKKWQIPLR